MCIMFSIVDFRDAVHTEIAISVAVHDQSYHTVVARIRKSFTTVLINQLLNSNLDSHY
jgi:hypothetical protein